MTVFFRKGYSTTGRILTLYTLTQKYFSKKGGKLYAVFVDDLRRALDSAQYPKLLDVLQKSGLSEHFTKAIMFIYINRSRLLFRYIKTQQTSLRQGCI